MMWRRAADSVEAIEGYSNPMKTGGGASKGYNNSPTFAQNRKRFSGATFGDHLMPGFIINESTIIRNEVQSAQQQNLSRERAESQQSYNNYSQTQHLKLFSSLESLFSKQKYIISTRLNSF